jgi:phosphatidylinositol alpha-1,6-mannosyltransferase
MLCDELPPDDVVVYTASMPGDAAYDAQQPFVVLRDPRSVLLPIPAVARRVVSALREHQCTRVVFGAAAPLGLLAPALRAAGAQEIVAHTHGHEVWWARVPGTRRLLRRIGDDVDELTYVSEWCRDRISPALSPRGNARLRALTPTVDVALFDRGIVSTVREELGIPRGALVVICVARMVRRKGQDTLVRMWPTVLEAFPGSVLLLVGDGPDRPRVERMVRRRRISETVRFVGSVEPDAVPDYLGAADVFAMPCRTRRFGLEAEAFGMVYLEAAAMGLPVVGGTSGGAPEAVRLARRLYGASSSTVPSSSPI